MAVTNPKDLNRIAEIGHMCLKEDTIRFNDEICEQRLYIQDPYCFAQQLQTYFMNLIYDRDFTYSIRIVPHNNVKNIL